MSDQLRPVRMLDWSDVPQDALDAVGFRHVDNPDAPAFFWLGTLSGFTLHGDEDGGVELRHRCQESGLGVPLDGPGFLANAVTAAVKHRQEGCK